MVIVGLANIATINNRDSQLRLESKYAAFSELLYWRNSESVLASFLSDSLGSKFYIFGVKNLKSSFLGLVSTKNKVIYLSHKITEYRDKRDNNNNWPPDVGNIDSIPSIFENKLVIIQPTAIDELRFKNEFRTGSMQSQNKYFLSDRWPVPHGDATLYIRPNITNEGWATPPDYFTILNPNCLDDDNLALRNEEDTVDYQFVARRLTYEVSKQVSSRDLNIVKTVDGVMVYRGLKEANNQLSGGVKAEINDWISHVHKTPKDKRQSKIVFIHFSSDIIQLVNSQNFRDYFLNNLHTFTNLALGKMPDFANSLSEEQKRTLPGLIAGQNNNAAGVFNDRIYANHLIEEYNQHRVQFLSIITTDILSANLTHFSIIQDQGDIKKFCGVFIYDNFEQFKSNSDEIVKFLESKPNGNSIYFNMNIDAFTNMFNI